MRLPTNHMTPDTPDVTGDKPSTVADNQTDAVDQTG